MKITVCRLTYSHKKIQTVWLSGCSQGKGSHFALYKDVDGTELLVIIPKRDPIPIGTLMSIMKQTQMELEDFYHFLTS